MRTLILVIPAALGMVIYASIIIIKSHYNVIIQSSQADAAMYGYAAAKSGDTVDDFEKKLHRFFPKAEAWKILNSTNN